MVRALYQVVNISATTMYVDTVVTSTQLSPTYLCGEYATPKIVWVTIPDSVAYQGSFSVTVQVESAGRDVSIDFKIDGPNVVATSSDFGIGRLEPDILDRVTFTINLRNYKGGQETLSCGLYNLTIMLYDGDKLVDSTTKEIEIVYPRMSVELPARIYNKGDTINVTIHTNRCEAGYDHIWVTLVGQNYKEVKNVALDEAFCSIGETSFYTSNLSPGSYKLYIRDTQGTIKEISEEELATEHYDLDPTNTFSRYFWAEDDLLVVLTVEVVEMTEKEQLKQQILQLVVQYLSNPSENLKQQILQLLIQYLVS